MDLSGKIWVTTVNIPVHLPVHIPVTFTNLATHKAGFQKLQFFRRRIIKWDASSRWSIRPNSAWDSKEITTIGKTHPTLVCGSKAKSFRKTTLEKIQSYIREIAKFQEQIQIAEISQARLHYDTVQDYHRKFDQITTNLLRPIFTKTLQVEAEIMLEERIQSYQMKDVTANTKSSSLIEPTIHAAESENTFVDGKKISDILIIAIKLWRENEEPIIEKFQFDLKVIQLVLFKKCDILKVFLKVGTGCICVMITPTFGQFLSKTLIRSKC